MRSLAQPAVLKSALIAGLLSAAVSYPRLSQWHGSPYPLWYLESLLLVGAVVLWAFVFAWHTQYTRRPVFTLNFGWRLFALTTASGLLLTLALHWWVDPWLRAQAPQDYPADLEQWLAMTLFSLAFTQLFLVVAPFAWLLRLSRGNTMAVPLTVLFGAVALFVKFRSPSTPLPPGMFAALLAARLVLSLASVYLLLRGGVLLVWWWGLLLQGRLLFQP